MSPSSITLRSIQQQSSEIYEGLIKFIDILLLIFDLPGGTRSVTGLRDTISPIRRTDKAKHAIVFNQKLSHSCEILKYVGLNFVLLTCESAVQGIYGGGIPLTIHNQCQNYSIVIASFRYSLPVGVAMVEPTKAAIVRANKSARIAGVFKVSISKAYSLFLVEVQIFFH